MQEPRSEPPNDLSKTGLLSLPWRRAIVMCWGATSQGLTAGVCIVERSPAG